MWIEHKKIPLNSIKILGHGDGEEIREFKDVGLKEDFKKFHYKLSKLRITSKRGNLSNSKIEKRESQAIF